jgi:hypothetical protein
MNRLIIFIGLGIILLAVALYFILRPKPVLTTTIKKGPFSLSSNSDVLNTSDFASQVVANSFYQDGQGTFQCFILLDSFARTGGHVDCIPSRTSGSLPSINNNSPSCDTGLYPICKCSSINDCGNCAHEGYQTVFTIHGMYTLEVMNVPDASRPNGIGAQMTVRTSNTDINNNIITQVETIPLPPIEHQKWVMFTLARDGRRIDIYYNNALVSSSKLQNIPSTRTNGIPLNVGNTLLSGKIGALRFLPNHQSINDVSAEYAKSVNTRGDPNMFITTLSSSSYDTKERPENSILSSLCLDGSCMTFPKIGEPNVSSYLNIFNIRTPAAGAPLSTEYA